MMSMVNKGDYHSFDVDVDNNNFCRQTTIYSLFQSFDGDSFSIDTEDDTVAGGLTCCSILC